MQQKHNEQLLLAWQRYRRTYRGILSQNAYVIGDLLYEYGNNLASDSTELIGDYFVIEYNKKWIAEDLGMDDSTFRKKKRGINLTVWQELEQIGFEIKNGFQIKDKSKNKTNANGVSTKFGLPIYIVDDVHVDTIELGNFYEKKFGSDKTRQYLINLNDKIKGTYQERINKKWYEIDYANQNINNYKLFDKDNQTQMQTKLSRQFLCLFAQKGIDVLQEGKTIFSMFFKLLKYVHGFEKAPYELLEKAIMKTHNSTTGTNIKEIYAYVFTVYSSLCSVALINTGKNEMTLIEDKVFESKAENTIDNMIKELKKQSESMGVEEKLEFYRKNELEYFSFSWKDDRYEYYLSKEINSLMKDLQTTKQQREEQQSENELAEIVENNLNYNDFDDEQLLLENY